MPDAPLSELKTLLEEINRDAWMDDRTRLRTIARTSDRALKLLEELAVSETGKWISVEDRLPHDGYVVALRKDGGAEICTVEVLMRERYGAGTWAMTHWMPLPDAPSSLRGRADG